MHAGFWWENLMQKDRLGNPSEYGRIILKWISKKQNAGTWTGLVWFKAGTSCGLF